MNLSKYFNQYRSYFGKLSELQVQGHEQILKAAIDAGLSIPAIAYVLATVFHETDRTMQPISEYGKGKGRAYGTWKVNSKGVKYCQTNGKGNVFYTYDEYPFLYYGMGYVQLTWYDNYKLLGEILGVDLLGNPELAKDPEIAAKIMIIGMTRGLFTGRKLGDYFKPQMTDYLHARKIINGMDAAQKIAEHARKYEKILQVAMV